MKANPLRIALFIAWPILVLLAIALSSGCARSRFTTPAVAKIATPTGVQVEQAGDVAVPAKAESASTTAEFTIPKDSVLRFDPVSKEVSLSFSRDVAAVSKSTVEVVTGPKSIAPPTPSEIAKAGTLAKFYWVSLGLLALAGLLGWEGHIKAAVIAGVGAVVVPVFARFLGSDAAQYAAVGILALAGGLWIAWHFLKDKLEAKASNT